MATNPNPGTATGIVGPTIKVGDGMSTSGTAN